MALGRTQGHMDGSIPPTNRIFNKPYYFISLEPASKLTILDICYKMFQGEPSDPFFLWERWHSHKSPLWSFPYKNVTPPQLLLNSPGSATGVMCVSGGRSKFSLSESHYNGMKNPDRSWYKGDVIN